MAIELGDGILRLKADSSALDNTLKGINSKLAPIGTAARNVALAITGAMTTAVTSFIKTGDTVDMLSNKLGLSTEAVSEFTYAADQSDTSMDALATGFKFMFKAVDSLTDGSKKSNAELKEMGLTVDDLKGKSPDQLFMRLADTIANVEDPIKETTWAMKLFGRSGTDLLPMLKQGAAGIKELRDQAHEMAYIFDAETAKAASDLDNDMRNLKSTLLAGAIQMGAVLAPAAEDLANKLREGVMQLREWAKEHPAEIKLMADWAIKLAAACLGIFAVTRAIALLTPAIHALNVAILFLVHNPMVALAAAVLLIEGYIIGKAIKAFIDWRKAVDDLAESKRKLAEQEGLLAAQQTKLQEDAVWKATGYTQKNIELIRQHLAAETGATMNMAWLINQLGSEKYRAMTADMAMADMKRRILAGEVNDQIQASTIKKELSRQEILDKLTALRAEMAEVNTQKDGKRAAWAAEIEALKGRMLTEQQLRDASKEINGRYTEEIIKLGKRSGEINTEISIEQSKLSAKAVLTALEIERAEQRKVKAAEQAEKGYTAAVQNIATATGQSADQIKIYIDGIIAKMGELERETYRMGRRSWWQDTLSNMTYATNFYMGQINQSLAQAAGNLNFMGQRVVALGGVTSSLFTGLTETGLLPTYMPVPNWAITGPNVGSNAANIGGLGVNVTVQNMNVRNDADIDLVATKLYDKITTEAGRKGIRL